MKIKVETLVMADLPRVWSAWITPEDINLWNHASDDWHTARSSIDLRVGGKFSYRMESRDGTAGFDFEGTYTKIVKQHRIEYVMADQRTVCVEFIPVEDGIKVVETFDADATHSVEQQQHGWQNILDNFTSHVESLA